MADNKISEETKDEVVKLYKDGKKNAEITERTGVPRPTIYYILERRGVVPKRQRAASDKLTAVQLLAALRDSEQHVGRLQAELAVSQEELRLAHEQVATLRKRRARGA